MSGMTSATTAPTLTFGDDGSPSADVAWLFVNNHTWPGWRVDIVTAQLPPLGPPLPSEVTALHRWDPPRPRRAFQEAGFGEVAHLRAEADPRLVLSRPSDLLVIGPRGAGMLKSMRLGSTADWLLVHPPAPLLVVRHGGPVHDVVLCVDGSAHAERATNALAGLPWIGGLDITVLAVDDGRMDVDKAARTACDRLQHTGAGVDVCVVSGKPTAAIRRHLDRAAPDLAVLGTRGLTGLRHLRLGSTAGAVARTAACSVLIACDEDEYHRTLDGTAGTADDHHEGSTSA